SFPRPLAADWAPRGVTVNAIAPGGFLTEPNQRWFKDKPELRHTFESQIPMGRFGEPDELAPLAVYLASDASTYMTGATLVIDGGYTLWEASKSASPDPRIESLALPSLLHACAIKIPNGTLGTPPSPGPGAVFFS